ncbi:hypothetical protein U9M48_002480 [Paspalum notatum var. saurae]|uniref:Wall-associated receptor kinase galacturonan-binding domain-containing protein n=1 Tax=Paspalum notatum var. saurae TaxID=547442 RepID=A0AAQ3PJV7_PASNO
MVPWSRVRLLIVAVTPVLVLRLLAAAAAAPPLGLPGCNTTCGGMEVPYPFGIGANCSLPGFSLTCDAGGAHNKPWLLLGHGGSAGVRKLHVTKIHLHNGTVYVADGGAILNYTSDPANQTRASRATWGLLDGGNRSDDDGPFVLSYHHNKFVVLGCNLQAKLLGKGNDSRLITGCSSFCTLETQQPDQPRKAVVWDPTEGGDRCGRCSGNGC